MLTTKHLTLICVFLMGMILSFGYVHYLDGKKEDDSSIVVDEKEFIADNVLKELQARIDKEYAELEAARPPPRTARFTPISDETWKAVSDQFVRKAMHLCDRLDRETIGSVDKHSVSLELANLCGKDMMNSEDVDWLLGVADFHHLSDNDVLSAITICSSAFETAVCAFGSDDACRRATKCSYAVRYACDRSDKPADQTLVCAIHLIRNMRDV